MIIRKDELDGFKKMIQDLAKQEAPFSLGKIDSTYSSSTTPKARPKVVFDGDTVASSKAYPYLSSYTPTANDRVLLVNVGGSHVIIGKII
jgi:hypothetical protein